MIKVNKNNIIIAKKTWNSLKEIDYFREILETLEDREELLQAINETKSISDFEKYDQKRRSRIDVQN